jgi:ribonucleoside-diphosphate reductase alpha chain
MCGEAYAESARISVATGPFAGYEKNREPFLEVMEKHRAAADSIPDDLVPAELLARQLWLGMLAQGQRALWRRARACRLSRCRARMSRGRSTCSLLAQRPCRPST